MLLQWLVARKHHTAMLYSMQLCKEGWRAATEFSIVMVIEHTRQPYLLLLVSLLRFFVFLLVIVICARMAFSLGTLGLKHG